MITLQFQDVKFQTEFGRMIKAAADANAILLNCGREVANLLRKHFRQKDKSGANKLSERRTHFWQQVAQSVQVPVIEGTNSVSVSINDPRFIQKVFGGPIIAKNAGALTIPVEERAYGRTAATFEAETGLKLILIKIGGTQANNFENAVLAAKENGHLTTEYILTKSVDQKADPDALPQKSAMEAAIMARGQKVLDRQLAGENPEANA